ncbi:YfhO family protein [Butyrivibrio sp. FC2001]|uniref:YfhO family protein n=1 Tax=Butyrivibrio sp. FC2001 TaxID=1280671 RepID=UPI00040A01C7|nr:YfhO family protein [Butyrivibrio sp. FC2001]
MNVENANVVNSDDSKETITFLFYCIAFGVTFLAMLVILAVVGYAPFGDKSLAADDGYWQYMDFFGYYKDVLTGKQSVLYALSNGLGQASLPVFMYYLASPWNLIIIFFDKTELHSFFDIVVALKIATSFVTCSFYLSKRFEKRIGFIINIALSFSYAFMHYNISKAQCPMWLDGVYMLPIMALGIYKLIRRKNPKLLAISFTASILFNWYTAGINCLFSFLLFILELSILYSDGKNETNIMAGIKAFVRYCYAMISGALLSMFIILPTLNIMRCATRGSADKKELTMEILGNCLNFFDRYSYGAISERGALGVYSGGLLLFGCICFMCAKTIPTGIKISASIILGICVFSCYWKPLFWLLSLFQESSSYYYRFSYIVTFAMLFMGAYLFAYNADVSWKKVFIFVSVFAVYLLRNCFSSTSEVGELKLYTVIVLVVVAFLLFLFFRNGSTSICKRTVFSLMILILTVFDVSYNASLLMKIYPSIDSVSDFEVYQNEQENMIAEIKNQDKSYYRITQTAARAKNINSLANLDEAMGFNYWGLENYTSTPDAGLINFYDKIGYKVYMSRLVEKAMSILTIDSLLGVKYIASPYKYEGLIYRKDLGAHNDKSIYENPYYMPMIFKYKADDEFYSDEQNAFLYNNQLFNYISGREKDVFVSIEYKESREGNQRSYVFDIPKGNYALYGNIPWKWDANATLDLNGRLNLKYSVIHSLGIFYVPISEGDTSAYVNVSAENFDAFDKPEFYLLDLNYLGEVSDQTRKNSLQNLVVTDTKVTGTIEADEGDYLFTSIPYADGWTVKVNEEIVEPEFIEDCLMIIPLDEGYNDVSMKYSCPLFVSGICLSVLGILLLLFYGGKL